MTISYPLSLPAVKDASSIDFDVSPRVGISESPFTGGQQTYDWQSERWMADFHLPPMKRADAEQWVGGFLLALRGRAGSFLMGQPGYTTPQGNWSGQSPLVAGASQTGYTLAVDGLNANSTGKAGDLFQLGSGSSARLHKLTKDFTANSGGAVTLDFVPALRSSPADNAALTLGSPKGIWMLQVNSGRWSIGAAMIYGLSFSAVEDLRDI